MSSRNATQSALKDIKMNRAEINSFSKSAYKTRKIDLGKNNNKKTAVIDAALN